LHFDAADGPLARRAGRILEKEGGERVAAEEEPDHHIAILTNRSSRSWVQNLTEERAGRLVYVIGSTIELGEDLSETARYQWVDFRNADPRDIETLARSLSNPERARREAGLEATPEMIDRWKVPAGVRLLRTVTELFGAAVLIFGISDFVGFAIGLPPEWTVCPESLKWLTRSALLIAAGVVCLWMGTRALVYRRVPAPIMYAFLLGAAAAASLGADAFPGFIKEWMPLALYLPFVLYSLLDGHYWLPAFVRSRPDEVGIKRSIERDFKRRNFIKVSVWLVPVLAVAIATRLL
jgi:hypothetical protein